uniref:RNase H family protein n=1 Tax=Solanum tuberosum TaxID=4113 RepID=M1CJN2_SOLTU
MSLGFPIDIEGDEEAGSSHRPNMSSGETENATGAVHFLEHLKMKMLTHLNPKKLNLNKPINNIGNRDKSDLRDQIYSNIESPIFELYSTEQRIKATMVLCDDVKKMELFIRIGQLEHQNMMFIIINDKL